MNDSKMYKEIKALIVKAHTAMGSYSFADCPFCGKFNLLGGSEFRTKSCFCARCRKLFQLGDEIEEEDYKELLLRNEWF